MLAPVDASQRIFDAIGAQLVLHRNFGDEPPRVAGDYEIVEIIGAGGFGLICRATQVALRRPVALKLFPLDGDDAGVKEALREARSLARLEHPGIVTVYAAGESEVIAGQRLPCAFVEMQLIDGVDLRDWLAAEPREAELVLAILLAAGRALDHAHAGGIVHRDFKPENLMVDRSGQAKVIDFGLALVAEAGSMDPALARWDANEDAIGSRVTGANLVRGTPGYMAPEASQGHPRAASDQFALAVVIREALTGQHPFAPSDQPSSAIPRGGAELFADIRPLIDRAMSPSPSDRYPSIAALCDAIEQWPGRTGEAPSSARRGWLLGAGLAGVAALALGVWATRDRVEPDATASVEPKAVEPEPTPAIAEPLQPSTSTSTPAQTEPDPEPAPAPAACGDLQAWMGVWQLASKVTWTEYAYQFEWRVDYELDLSLGERCTVTVAARKYPPLIEGEPPGEPVETTTTAVTLRDADGLWRLPLRLAFPGDGRTYSTDESYETLLLFDRVGDRPRVRGAFRKVNEDGHWIRLGLLEGARDVAPDPRTITTDKLACAARCRIDCAGIEAERACFDRGCAPLDEPADICGPASFDFKVPMRAAVARKSVRDGKDLFAEALERGNKAKQLVDADRNASTLAGRWGLWLGDAYATMQLEADGHRLRGTVAQGEASVDVEGFVTGAGTWVLTPISTGEPASWLADPLVLVGVGERGPAFGSDAAASPRTLRAFRLQ